MMGDGGSTQNCGQCGKTKDAWEMVSMTRVRATVPQRVLARHPGLAEREAICSACFADLRIEQLKSVLDDENVALHEERTAIYNGFDVLELMQTDINAEIDRHRTVGERISDVVTGFVGSWAFIIAQIVFLMLWILINTYLILWIQFDPYPFIFLNLVLSWAAALQVPLIMMSQNRQNDRDRERSQHDYQVNMLAESEVRHLHQKLDQLLLEHWQRLVDLERQTLMMEQQADDARPPDADEQGL